MVTILDYKASVPDNRSGIVGAVIPQTPQQQALADLGLFLQPYTEPGTNKVILKASVGVEATQPLFNNNLIFRIYRDGFEIYNFIVGVGVPTAGLPAYYLFTFEAVDEAVPSGFHIYLLRVSAAINTAQSSVRVSGPITFSGLAVSET